MRPALKVQSSNKITWRRNLSKFYLFENVTDSHDLRLKHVKSLPYYCQPPGSRAFSRNFTTNITPQCWAFSQALKTEKLNAPLFPGPRWVVDINYFILLCTLYYQQLGNEFLAIIYRKIIKGRCMLHLHVRKSDSLKIVKSIDINYLFKICHQERHFVTITIGLFS